MKTIAFIGLLVSGLLQVTLATELIPLVPIPEGKVTVGIDAAQYSRLLEEIAPTVSSEAERADVSKSLLRELGEKEVQVEGFFIKKTEVTNGEYEIFVKSTGHRFPFHWWSEEDRKDYLQKVGEDVDLYEVWASSWKDLQVTHFDLDSERRKLPVVFVTYDDAVAYTRWAGMRLPTEVEWQRAAVSETNWYYPWRDTWDPAVMGALHLDGRSKSAERPYDGSVLKPAGLVGSKMASVFGVEDLSGNVFEFVDQPFLPFSSEFEKTFEETGVDVSQKPTFDSVLRIAKGGSFEESTPTQAANAYRVNFRRAVARSEGSRALGFRTAKSLIPGLDFAKGQLADFQELDEGRAPLVKASFGVERWDLTGNRSSNPGVIERYQGIVWTPVGLVDGHSGAETRNGLEEWTLKNEVLIGYLTTTDGLEKPFIRGGVHSVYFRIDESRKPMLLFKDKDGALVDFMAANLPISIGERSKLSFLKVDSLGDVIVEAGFGFRNQSRTQYFKISLSLRAEEPIDSNEWILPN